MAEGELQTLRDRATKFNDNPTVEDAWWDELELVEWGPDDYDTVDCAELADELVAFKVMADADPGFLDSLVSWDEYICEHTIWLLLEQCCHQGVLLPEGQIELRVMTCPRELRDSLGFFLGRCPAHVKHHLALQYWLLVRIDRARRTGSPEWRPSSQSSRP